MGYEEKSLSFEFWIKTEYINILTLRYSVATAYTESDWKTIDFNFIKFGSHFTFGMSQLHTSV